MGQVEKTISKDGTPIACWRSGNGSPLILVHGASTDHTSFRFLTPLLEQQFTIYSIDRRGRGESGDSGEYSIECEFEDLAAVIDSIGEPVDVFGHSYGASISLGASLITQNLRKLILYEPSPGVLAISHEVCLDLMYCWSREGERTLSSCSCVKL